MGSRKAGFCTVELGRRGKERSHHRIPPHLPLHPAPHLPHPAPSPHCQEEFYQKRLATLYYLDKQALSLVHEVWGLPFATTITKGLITLEQTKYRAAKTHWRFPTETGSVTGTQAFFLSPPAPIWFLDTDQGEQQVEG